MRPHMAHIGMQIMRQTPLAQRLESREGRFGKLAFEMRQGARIAVAHEPATGVVLTGSNEDSAVEVAREGW